MQHSMPRILIYSHDTFGLGHLRRCRAIAHSLARSFDKLSVIILSGSPIIGSFDFRSRVDFVRIPGVIKLRNGEYTSLNLTIGIGQTLAMRASIIKHTADIFEPDIFIVDKEPLGLRGEVSDTLQLLKKRGTRLVLGLRDVLDDEDMLREEWERKDVYPALEELYDENWIYGLHDFHNPLKGLNLSQKVLDNTLYTGFLRRNLPQPIQGQDPLPFDGEPFILVTPGGGGDGIQLVDWVMRAYEAREAPLFPALIVLGPFMDGENQAEFMRRSENLRNVQILRFTPHLEHLMMAATAVVGMGGYNTFCEVLSFNKPTLLIPRIVPRREQAIRAARAQEVGLARVLPIEYYPDIDCMVKALSELPRHPAPLEARVPGLLDGLDVINHRVHDILNTPRQTLQQNKLLSETFA